MTTGLSLLQLIQLASTLAGSMGQAGQNPGTGSGGGGPAGVSAAASGGADQSAAIFDFFAGVVDAQQQNARDEVKNEAAAQSDIFKEFPQIFGDQNPLTRLGIQDKSGETVKVGSEQELAQFASQQILTDFFGFPAIVIQRPKEVEEIEPPKRDPFEGRR